MGRVFRRALSLALLLLAAWPAPLCAGGRVRAAALLPHRLLYVIPAGVERTLTVGTPELRALQDTLATLFVASLDGQLLSLFENRTVLRTTAAEDSQLAVALAERTLFNRYDELVVARATVSGEGLDLLFRRIHARVVVAFRPWDPAAAFTLTADGYGAEAPDTTLHEAAGNALDRATRAVARALTRQKWRLMR